jgi:hypothetical protein
MGRVSKSAVSKTILKVGSLKEKNLPQNMNKKDNDFWIEVSKRLHNEDKLFYEFLTNIVKQNTPEVSETKEPKPTYSNNNSFIFALILGVVLTIAGCSVIDHPLRFTFCVATIMTSFHILRK